MTAKFVRDLLKYLPSMVVPALIGLVTIPIVAHFFTPEDYGQYILVKITISVLLIIIGWLSMAILRFYPEYEKNNRIEEFYSTVVKLLFLSVFIVVFLFYVVLSLLKKSIDSSLYSLMLIGLSIFVFNAVFDVLLNFLRIRREVNAYNVFRVWESVASLGLGVFLVFFIGMDVEGLLWGMLISLFFALPFLWKSAVKYFAMSSGFSKKLSLEMFTYGVPLMVGNLAAWVLSLSDRYILNIFYTSREVGIYSLSYAVSEKSILFLSSLFLLASRPLGMRIWENEREDVAKEYITNITRFYLILSIPMVVGLSVLGELIINVVGSPEYYEGYRIISFVAVSGLLLGLQQEFQVPLIFKKKTNLIMLSILISGLLNIVLNFIFIPEYGYFAAAVSTLVSYVVLLVSVIVFSRNFLIWKFPFKTLLRVLVCSAIMGFFIYLINNFLESSLFSLTILVILGVIIYAISIYIVGEIEKKEKHFLIEKIRYILKKI
ncbi:lipopolysaccharide biosynthesis protein [candidate division WOR-3 bacterium]|nr:lipopolysaccharide biosynthesis protein [candidate division WOR-3 bacterium]